MIAARPICDANAARPRQMITAGSSGDSEKRGACSSAGRAREQLACRRARRSATNASAIAAVTAIEPTSTPPSAATPAATATSSSARMSSTIAAPRIVRLVRPLEHAELDQHRRGDADAGRDERGAEEQRRRRALAERDAERDAARERDHDAEHADRACAVGPTSRRSDSFVSRPTQNSRKTTPSSANTSSTSPGSTRPKHGGADEHAGEDLADERRLAQAPEQLVAELGGEQHDEQVRQDVGDTGGCGDGGHGRVLSVWPGAVRADQSSRHTAAEAIAARCPLRVADEHADGGDDDAAERDLDERGPQRRRRGSACAPRR